MQLKVVGLDPSLRNWGIAKGTLNLDSLTFEISDVSVVNPVLPTGKQVRQNSKDIESARQLWQSTYEAVKDANIVFVEVPIGSQSARAMASYGICVGVLGSIRTNTPFFEIAPTEVKMATVGSKTATKEQMIQWATQAHPEANWPTYRRNGEVLVSDSKAEHMADAIATIQAGIRTNEFKQYKNIIYANQPQTTRN